ncbi:MAG: hypothetical protein Kow0098_13900 [Ignavibacteriaceae bacterium]
MKKSSKPFITTLFGVLIIASVFVLLSVGVKLKYETLTKEKAEIEQNLKTLSSIKVNFIAEVQMLSDEPLITEIAVNQLGMIKRYSPAITVEASREKIKEVSRKLKEWNEKL